MTTQLPQQSSLTTLELLTELPRLDENQWQSLGILQAWLVMVRAPVLVMTMTAVATGLLLAWSEGFFYADRAICALLGLTLAHATNNLINDWVDHRQGVDKDNYFRARYGTHVLEDQLVPQSRYMIATLLTGLLALSCGIYLIVELGYAVLILVLIGSFFVVFYTWPLKHFALGEISVLLVWGPLIVGGTYFLMTETFNYSALVLSIVAGIPPTLVIFAKHMDKLSEDANKSIHTLPVVIGLAGSRTLCLALIGAQCLLLGLLWQPWVLVCVLSVPTLVALCRILTKAPPGVKPDDYPEQTWPLWYSAHAFLYARHFGLMLMIGLIVKAVVFS